MEIHHQQHYVTGMETTSSHDAELPDAARHAETFRLGKLAGLDDDTLRVILDVPAVGTRVAAPKALGSLTTENGRSCAPRSSQPSGRRRASRRASSSMPAPTGFVTMSRSGLPSRLASVRLTFCASDSTDGRNRAFGRIWRLRSGAAVCQRADLLSSRRWRSWLRRERCGVPSIGAGLFKIMILKRED